MTDDPYFILRIFGGAAAIIGAAFLLYSLASGRSSFGERTVRRAENAKGYWLGIVRVALIVAGMALAATVAPNSLMGPTITLFIFVPTLIQALLTGRFDWEADDRRIDSPRRFWGWVAFYAFLCLMMGAIVLVELVWPRAA
jgi:hypothetical protein